MSPPALNDNPGLLECVEYLPVEQLITHSGIEALDIVCRLHLGIMTIWYLQSHFV